MDSKYVSDKEYDYPDIGKLVKNYGYTAHIRSCGEENIKILGFQGKKVGCRKNTFLD
jgi:hypothetical protein